ncbi:hypothetical protein J4458_03580 [Candidatus Woesearchaeota archaeon]|nr:hypothetical protein [Candidatus Woesearchaeota archaeon]
MDLDQELKKQAVIVDLIRALKVDEQRKLHISGVLYNRDIDELVNQKDIEAIKAKLSGRRVVLNPRQKELAIVVEHLADFDDSIGSWITNLSKGDTVYAIEHVLMGYDANTRKFVAEGTGSHLVGKLSFPELQVLKRYSKFAADIEGLYKSVRGKLNFSKDANTVAKFLVGKSLYLPVYLAKGKRPKDTYVTLIETEGFETDETVTRQRYCMLASPGELRTMPFRGLNLLNVGTLEAETPSCVMINAIAFGDQFIEGPGRVGNVLNATRLEGKVLNKDIEIIGNTAKSGYMPGPAQYSTGRYRMQEPLKANN